MSAGTAADSSKVAATLAARSASLRIAPRALARA